MNPNQTQDLQVPVNETINSTLKGDVQIPRYNRRQRRAIESINRKQSEKNRKLDAKRLASYRQLEKWRLDTKELYTPSHHDAIFREVLQKLFKHNFKKPFDLYKMVRSVESKLGNTPETEICDADTHS